MIDKAKHVAAASEAVRIYRQSCGTIEEHVIADLICDLGHLAELRGLDFLGEAKRGVGHWFAERHTNEGDLMGPDAIVEISVCAR